MTKKEYNHTAIIESNNQDIFQHNLKVSPFGKVSDKALALITKMSPDPRTRASLLAIYTAFCSHCHRNYSSLSFASLKRIQEITGLCTPTFNKNCEKLFTVGLLSRKKEDDENERFAESIKKLSHRIPAAQRLIKSTQKRLEPVKKHIVHLPYSAKEKESFILIPTALFHICKKNHITHAGYLLCVHLLTIRRAERSGEKYLSTQEMKRRTLAKKLQVSVTTIQLAISLLSTILVWEGKQQQIIRKVQAKNRNLLYRYYLNGQSPKLQRIIIILHPK